MGCRFHAAIRGYAIDGLTTDDLSNCRRTRMPAAVVLCLATGFRSWRQEVRAARSTRIGWWHRHREVQRLRSDARTRHVGAHFGPACLCLAQGHFVAIYRLEFAPN